MIAGLQQLSRLVEREPAAAADLIRDVTGAARRALTELTELGERIHPPILAVDALPSLVRRLATRAG